MSGPIWMPFYPADYLSDTGHLETVEHGAYLLLMLHAWRHNGALPADHDRLRRITRLERDQWAESKDVLLEFFHLDGESYRHDRIDAELEKAAAKVEAAKRAGKASGKARARRPASDEQSLNDRSADVEQPLNGRSTNAERKGQRNTNKSQSQSQSPLKDSCSSPDGNERAQKKSVSKKGSSKPAERFHEFWELYPRKEGKARALKVWKAKGLDHVADAIIEDVKARLEDPGQWAEKRFTPHGSTYISHERWLDDWEPASGDQSTLPRDSREDIEAAQAEAARRVAAWN